MIDVLILVPWVFRVTTALSLPSSKLQEITVILLLDGTTRTTLFSAPRGRSSDCSQASLCDCQKGVVVVKYKDRVPKHTMPCMPCPALFRPPSMKEGGAERRREKSDDGPVRGRIRGPWDHSGSIAVRIDVDVLLKVPGVVVIRGEMSK